MLLTELRSVVMHPTVHQAAALELLLEDSFVPRGSQSPVRRRSFPRQGRTSASQLAIEPAIRIFLYRE